ncbi:MAG TPA: M15 family metallopeptidase [Candidatus Saccharimonadales bacterium]|nr:M15 family metallopeptidase [Candidatus Saccharimonadales bacterium]
MNIISNPENPCPPEILNRQVAIPVSYIDFDDNPRTGTIEINEAVQGDVGLFFEVALDLKFPIERVLPAGHPDYRWDDDKLMAGNVSSGFNYRPIAGTDRVSVHAYGRAFDINPRINPYIRLAGGKTIVAPPEAKWDKSVPGALYAEHPLVRFMEERGWEWGGRWVLSREGMVDYQHFEKPEE